MHWVSVSLYEKEHIPYLYASIEGGGGTGPVEVLLRPTHKHLAHVQVLDR